MAMKTERPRQGSAVVDRNVIRPSGLYEDENKKWRRNTLLENTREHSKRKEKNMYTCALIVKSK